MAASKKSASRSQSKKSARSSKKSVPAKPSYCALPPQAARVFGADIDPHRASLIRSVDDKWVNGTVLHYCFLQDSGLDGTAAERTIVTKAFKAWKDVGVGLDFKEVAQASEAEIRIGFLRGDGAWSYIGRYILNIAASERTMNFGWRLQGGEGLDTAIHEIGHTLGFPHEHQNPNAGIEWDEQVVYDTLAGPPNNWPPETTYHNIIRKLPVSSVEGGDWDPKSIMHYPFEPDMIAAPEPWATTGVPNPDGLSADDKALVLRFYPPLDDDSLPVLEPFRSQAIHLDPGDQADFAIEPTATRTYEFRTFGAADVVMVLFEEVDGNPRFMTADDDSGEGRNATFNVRLLAGRKYLLRVRMYYRMALGDTAVMFW